MKRRLLVAWLHLATLSALALARPLFEVLADSPEFFVARGNTTGDILLLAFALVLVPPTVLLALELPFIRFEAVRRSVHAGFVGLLAALIALQALGELADGPAALLIGAAVLLGALAGVLYHRGQVLETALTVLSPAPIVVLVLFLVFSPVSKLIWDDEDEASAGTRVPGDTPVVFLLFDELSLATLMDAQGGIDAGRYPNLARLADESTWYRGATTVADETAQAVPAILTGLRPDHGLLPIYSDHPRNLFTLLGDSYSLHVRESVTRLCPERLCEPSRPSTASRLESLASDLSAVSLHLLLPEDLESDLPAVDQTFSEFGDAEGGDAQAGAGRTFGRVIETGSRSEIFGTFLRGIHAGGARPTLHLHHSQLPHVPWEYLPSGQSYRASRQPTIPGAAPPPWSREPIVTRQSFGRYALQVGYVDRLVGQVVDRLRRTGLYRRSLVVLTSDHGVSFRPGQPRRLVTKRNFADLAGVPLIIKAPDQRRGRIVDTPALTVDILPTIADHLSTRLPWSHPGRSLIADPESAAGRLRIDSFDGDVLRSGYSRYREDLSAAVARELRLGRRTSGLEGRLAADLASAGRDGAEISYDAPDRYLSVDPRAALVPTFVSGRLRGDAAAGRRLAVVVNGRIRAVTETYRSEGEISFGAMIPVRSLRRGRNQVEVFGIREGRAGLALVPFKSGDRRLVERDGRTFIQSPSGESIEVRPGAVGGFVETLATVGGRVVVAQGWAADAERGQPAERLLLFSGGRLLDDEVPSKSRPDLVKAYGPKLRRAGFLLGAGAPRGGELPDLDSLRVVAVLGKRASELDVLDDAKR